MILFNDEFREAIRMYGNPFYHGSNKKQCWDEANCIVCFIRLCVIIIAGGLSWRANKKR